MRISDWSSDVCSSDLHQRQPVQECRETGMRRDDQVDVKSPDRIGQREDRHNPIPRLSACCKSHRSEEHTSELQSLMRISYAVFCLNKKTATLNQSTNFFTLSK